MNDDEGTADLIKDCFEIMVQRAEEDGYIVTIQQEPLQPLAMRNYKTVVTVREKR
jgi:hypothetical protein